MDNIFQPPQEVNRRKCSTHISRRRLPTPLFAGIVLALVLCIAPYGLSAAPGSAHAASLTGMMGESSSAQRVPRNAVAARVTRVIDGDTIQVRINRTSHRVRYIGMDTPERGDACFKAASDLNAAYVAGQTVYLEKDVSETDRYGRLLRYVWTADGVNVNVALVRRGYALAYTWPPDVKYERQILAAQRTARNNNAGCLWDN